MATINNESNTNKVSTETSGTTVFLDDAATTQNVISPLPQKVGLLPVRDQSISDFLAKPQLLTTISWNTTQIANTSILSIQPSTALTLPIYANKISGFRYIRATAVIRLVINAEPFHAGKLILSFVPCELQLSGNKFRRLCLNQATQQPNVELDCRESMCMMKIPYISPHDYYDLSSTATTFGWGVLTLKVLSPFKTGSGGASDLDLSAFIHFEDVELTAPTLPQSSLKTEKRKARPTRAKGVPVSAEETKALSKGPLSRALMSGAEIADALATIPTLAPIALPASWVARGMSGVASWFGWSKPMTDAPPAIVSRRMAPNMANATGVNTAPTLGLFHDTSLTVLDNLGGVPQDEMSFAYLKSVKAYTSSFTMSTTQLTDSVLYSKSISPLLLGQYVASGGTGYNWACNSYPPGAYLANYFKYWKGGVKLHLKIAKTDYHSGRILVTFTPGNNPTAPTTCATSVYSLREIIDIRETSEFVMDLPYLLNTPYVPTNFTSGFLNVIVLNELRAPPVVANTIDFIVYYSFCEDYELAVPDGSSPNTAGAPKSAVPFFPQSGTDDPTKVVIGGYTCGNPSTEDAEMCVGECFTSIKQLVSRYSKALFLNTQSTSNGYIQVPPYFLGGVYSNSVTGVMLVSEIYGDAISAFASGYAFMRGSTKLMATTVQIATATIPLGIAFKWEEPANNAITAIGGGLTQKEASSGDVFQYPYTQHRPVQLFDATGITEVSVPYYNNVSRILVDSFYTGSSSAQLLPTSVMPSVPRTMVGLGFEGTSNYNITLRRSAGEDFQVGYFLGFPPILSAYAAV